MSPVLLLWVFVVVTAGILLHGVKSPERMYQYPYFMTTTFGVFLLPQAVSLIRFPGAASATWIGNALLMVILCIAACIIGYALPPLRWIRQIGRIDLNRGRAQHGALVFAAIAWFCTWKINTMTEEETGATMWTGAVTIYAFFAGLALPALGIALTGVFRGDRLSWPIAIIAVIPPLSAAILYGRRELFMQVVLTCVVMAFSKSVC